jgi:YegS/Rv2252/BmrU family lipid kinase
VKPFLIVNPASAGGRTGRHFDEIARAVRGELGEFEWAFTRAPGDGRTLAREAVRAGGELVVAVGGDGTASEVIDGLLSPGGSAASFGFIPRGTGGDLRRSVGCPSDPAGAARAIAAGATRVCDLGVVELTRPDGGTEVRHFANVAGFGISGRVVSRMGRRAGLLPGRLAFMLASARELAGWRDQPVRWRADGGPWREDRVTAFSICNGRYFGGGMMVAPRAELDDGLFDVTIWQGLGLADFALKRSMLYDGTHLRLPNTTSLRARTVEAEPLEGAEVLLDVDGEQPGRLPARFRVLPGALRIRA